MSKPKLIDLSGLSTIYGHIKALIDAKYAKPSGGIPKDDLADAVQASLNLADSALQSVPSTYRTASDQDDIDDAQDAAIAAVDAKIGNVDIAPKLFGTLHGITSKKYIIYNSGAEASSSTYSATGYINVSGLRAIRYTRIAVSSTTNTGGMAFYDASKRFIAGVRNITGAPSYALTMARAIVPSNAVYARFTTDGPLFELYDDDQYEGALTTKMWAESLGLHSAPINDGAANIVKRCRRYTDIEWIPAVDLPRLLSIGGKDAGGVFTAGKKYKGVPYGRANPVFMNRYGRSHFAAGQDVVFDTFLTAVQNSESLVCKEAQLNMSNNETMPYSAVCSTMVSYALNVGTYTTSTIPSIPGMAVVDTGLTGGAVADGSQQMDLNRLMIGDILNYNVGDSGHTGLISDLYRDDDGTILFVEVSEETTASDGIGAIDGATEGGVARRRVYAPDEFFEFWGQYTLYRYIRAHFVTMADSQYADIAIPNRRKIDTPPTIPYEGNGFRYITGHIPRSSVRILICSDLYSHLRVQKDGVDIAASPIAINGADYVDITEIGAGEYKAWLCDVVDGVPTNGTWKLPAYWRIS